MLARTELLCLGLLVLPGLAACSKKAPAAPAPPPPKVVVDTVVERTIPNVMRFTGTVKSIRSIEVIPRVDGILESREFTEGHDVAEGDVLYHIDPRTYQATLEQAQAQLARDQASFDFYQSELKRYEEAGTAGAVSTEQVDQARASRDEAQASIEQDRADIESAQLDLDFTTIHAPFAGRTDQTLINAGELVTAYESVLTTLTQMDPVYVIFNVSRADFFRIERMMEDGKAPTELAGYQVHLTLPDGDAYGQTGTLDFVSARIDPTTDTMTARAVFPNPRGPGGRRELIPGQYVPVGLRIGEEQALLIPAVAVVQSQVGAQVYVVGQGDTVSLRRVELGARSGDQRIVTKGLKAGERVVVQGVQKVRDGGKVVPTAAPAKGAAGQTASGTAASGASGKPAPEAGKSAGKRSPATPSDDK